MAVVFGSPQAKTVPVGPVTIDWNHPLATGLIACWVPGVSYGINLVQNGTNLAPDLTIATAAKFGVNADGPALTSIANNGGLSGLSTAPFVDFTNGQTLFWRGLTTGPVSTSCAVGQYTDITNPTTPLFVLKINSASNPTLFWNNAGVGNNGGAGGLTLTSGAMYTLAGTGIAGGNAILYAYGATAANGVQNTTAFGATSPTGAGALTGVLLNFSENLFNRINGVCNIGCIWNRVLSSQEIDALNADPYQFLIPVEGEMPVLQGAAAAVVPPFIPNSNDNFNVRQAAQRAAAALLIVTQPFVPFNTTQVVPAVAKGWYNQLSPMPKSATVQPTLPTQFAAPYQNTIPGIGWHRWLDPINGGVRNAKAQPTQTTQFAVPASVAPPAQTPGQFGWWANLSKSAAIAARSWPTQTTQFAVPASVAPPAQTPGQFGWWANLSKSAPVAKAQPGNAFIPFNTRQVVISPQTVPLNYDAGSVQQRIVYYQSRFQVLGPVAATPNTITGMAWHQPLGVVPPIIRAQQGNTFVPLNARQVNSITGMGWFQPLSRSAPVAIAQAGFSFVPFNTKQVVTVQVAFDPFVKKRSKPKRDRLRDELEIKYKRRLAIEDAFYPPTTYELPPYKLPEHVKPAPDVSDLANVIMQVQQMRAAQAKQQDEEDEKALLELLKREYGIEDV